MELRWVLKVLHDLSILQYHVFPGTRYVVGSCRILVFRSTACELHGAQYPNMRDAALPNSDLHP